MRNTFLNAQMGPIAHLNLALLQNAPVNPKIRWTDLHYHQPLATEGDPALDLCFQENPKPITIHREIS